MSIINFNNLQIVKLDNSLVNEVYLIEKELVGDVSIQTISNTISNENLNYFVLKNGEDVVGFFECFVIAPEAELYTIAVKKEFQRKGYASVMLDYFINYSKDNGCNTILLEVNKINKPAINLYNKFGFVCYGERKNYYGDSDAVLMKKLI